MKNRIIALILAIFASSALPAIAGSSGVAGGAGPSGLSPVGTGAVTGDGSSISYGTLGVGNGGTGLTTLGTASQQIRVNSGGTALEWFTPTGGGAASGANSDITSLSGLTTPLSQAQGGTGSSYGAGLVAGPTSITITYEHTYLTASDPSIIFYKSGLPAGTPGQGQWPKMHLPLASSCPGKIFTFVQTDGFNIGILYPSGDDYLPNNRQILGIGGGDNRGGLVQSFLSDGVSRWIALNIPIAAAPGNNSQDYVLDAILTNSNGFGFAENRYFTVDESGQVKTGTWNAGAVTTPALAIPAGSNKKIGSGTLSSGTCTVSNTSVTANSKIFVTPTSKNANSGALTVTAKTAATSFVVDSLSNTDDNSFDYIIVEAP